jgi:phage host-nuclease inhibitor protein Gam
MAKTREKKVVVTGVTRERMEESFGEYALADAKIQGINAKMDAEITKIRDKNAADLARLQKQKDDSFAVLETYAIENREELFSKKKSMDTAHGTIGFRTGTPKLKTQKGFTWAAVLALLKTTNKAYVRTTEEVAKDKLLTDRETKKAQELMQKVGIRVDQDETFFVEPKKEEQGAE